MWDIAQQHGTDIYVFIVYTVLCQLQQNYQHEYKLVDQNIFQNASLEPNISFGEIKIHERHCTNA